MSQSQGRLFRSLLGRTFVGVGSAGVRSSRIDGLRIDPHSLCTHKSLLLSFLPLSPSSFPVCLDLCQKQGTSIFLCMQGNPPFAFVTLLTYVTKFCLTCSRCHFSVLPGGCNFLKQAVLTHAGLWLRQWHSGIHISIHFTLCRSRV